MGEAERIKFEPHLVKARGQASRKIDFFGRFLRFSKKIKVFEFFRPKKRRFARNGGSDV